MSVQGGALVAEVLQAQGVEFLFTLCGGHISPILVESKRRGIRVVDTRHEATAVFAADAVARLTGRPGVAAVTAGPGVTNTITAVKNAQMAQSPVVLIGGAAPTALKGRGALQDIDQQSLFTSIVKWRKAVRRVRDLGSALEEAFRQALTGVPGPVFVECPVDLLYDEALIRGWYDKGSRAKTLGARALQAYLNWHVDRLFAGADGVSAGPRFDPPVAAPSPGKVEALARRLESAERPVLLVGSQALLGADEAGHLADAITRLGVPAYLSGMARGLLGKGHPLQVRHKRRQAFKEADLVVLAGVPCDFRLDYGNHIRRTAFLASINRSRTDLNKNRRPDLGLLADPALGLRALAGRLAPEDRWGGWKATLRERDAARNAAIDDQARADAGGKLNPLALCQAVEARLGPQSILVADGGDFVATASYILSPWGPLTWLDPGAFGTLGVGAGFALGAKLCCPEAEVWIIYGDGSVGYSLSEFDTFVRHGIPVIALVGNDAGWTQIAREQVEILKDDVGTVLDHTDYHLVARGFGGEGCALTEAGRMATVLAEAQAAAAAGRPVLVNAVLGKTDFRKGSISM